LRRARELVITGEPLVDALDLRAARKPFVRAAGRGQERRAQQGKEATEDFQPGTIFI